ncbi:LapA family protein [Mycobacterium sp.]|uniref:LapA family protein n=1 Tax=Mycobacterium sp. TaxID=1785 RepID=UPI0025F26EAF|nr:LapA family protein [Mycobacterium sp.]
MTAHQNPTDHARTTHQRAGEWFKNSRDMLGIFLLAVGVVAMVVCLAAAAYGSTGWSYLMGGIAGTAGAAGTAWLLVEGRRVRRVEAKRSADLNL